MRGRAVAAAPQHESDLAAILAGLVLIFRKRILLGTISLDLFAVLFSGATALIPVFAQDILHVGADGGGLLRSAQGFGALVARIQSGNIRSYAGWLALFAALLLAASYFGWTAHFWVR